MADRNSNKLKDPNALLDYGVDWSSWLDTGETIASSSWTVPDGITQASPAPSHNGSVTTIWLSGGTETQTYTVTNRITTSAGRTDERSLFITIRNR